MSHEQYLQQLKSLSINDLQLLLTYAGQSRTGKRYELIEHCYTLIKSSKLIQEKFEELYNKRCGQGDTVTIPYPKDLKNHSQKTQQQQQINHERQFIPLTFNEDICTISHSNLISPSKQLPNGLHTLANFYFLLTAQQASDVATSTYFNTDQSKLEFSKQILLRFTTIADSTNNGIYTLDKLPPNLHVIVNNRVVLLPQPKPTAKPNSDVIRPGRPVDITEYCRLSPLISNLVEISWFIQDLSIPLPTYVASVFLTERKTVPQLLARLSRSIMSRPATETQKYLIQTLSKQENCHGIDDDLEVASTSLRLPLECPALRIRMRMPGRARTCKHVHCFDIEGYLRMNEKKPTWLCPVCNKAALYTDLFIDQFFIDIIDKCSLDTKAIEYEKTGQWKEILEEKLSRKAQREKDAYKAANVTNGKVSIDTNQSGDNDSDDEPIQHKPIERQTSTINQEDIPIIELDDD